MAEAGAASSVAQAAAARIRFFIACLPSSTGDVPRPIRRGRQILSVQGADQPQDQDDDEHRAEHAAEAGAAVVAVGVIAAAAAEQQQQDDDDDDEAHGATCGIVIS